MKCTKCNTENTEYSKFCVKCGAPLKKEKRKKNLRIIGIIIIIFIAILAVALFLVNTSSTDDSYNTVKIDGAAFKTPEKGFFKSENNYRFNYSDSICTVKLVDFFESENPTQIQATELEKYYPGAESYINYSNNGDVWYGLKIKKDSNWYHISIKTTESEEAIQYFDWMYEHNEWEGHE